MALEASIRGATEDGHNNDSDRGCLAETTGPAAGDKRADTLTGTATLGGLGPEA